MTIDGKWTSRAPNTEHTLRRIAEAGLDIGTVVDVGVLKGTPKLYNALPKAHHVLIEPSPAHTDAIAKAYEAISHELFSVAASDVDADAFLVDRANDGGNRVTHSKVVATQAEIEEITNILEVHDMPLRRLDTILQDAQTPGEILLKIDVDGHEMNVLRGAADTLKRTAVVSIEASRDHLPERAGFLAEAGFMLFDIVDLCYYRNSLWQVDLFFVRKDLRDKIPDLRPSPADRESKFERGAYFEYDARAQAGLSAAAGRPTKASGTDEVAATLAERDALREDLRKVLEDRDATRAQLDITVTERDATHAQLDTTTAERDAIRAQLATALAERDTARSETRTALKQRDWAKRYPWKNFKYAAKQRLTPKS